MARQLEPARRCGPQASDLAPVSGITTPLCAFALKRGLLVRRAAVVGQLLRLTLLLLPQLCLRAVHLLLRLGSLTAVPCRAARPRAAVASSRLFAACLL